MKLSNRYVLVLLAIFFAVSSATLFSARSQAQDEGWLILRADYGYKSLRNDVTDILKDLIARGGVNGQVAVSNQTMGGDPAKGKDKSLHILARNRRREEREFTFNENDYVDVRLFSVRREDWDDRERERRRDPDDRPAYSNYDRDRDRDASRSLVIVSAYYGVQGRTINVTDVLRSNIREGTLSVLVTNGVMGGDPAQGYDKILIVVYRYQGVETATPVREGTTLSLP